MDDEPAHWSVPKPPDRSDGQPVTIALAFYNPVRGRHDTMTIDVVVFGALWQTARTVGMASTQRMLAFIARLMSDEPPSDDALQRLSGLLQAVQAWRGDEAMVLRMSYELLHHRQITREEAAQFASGVLGETIEREAWRKRVDRWADKAGLPPAGKPRPGKR